MKSERRRARLHSSKRVRVGGMTLLLARTKARAEAECLRPGRKPDSGKASIRLRLQGLEHRDLLFPPSGIFPCGQDARGHPRSEETPGHGGPSGDGASLQGLLPTFRRRAARAQSKRPGAWICRGEKGCGRKTYTGRRGEGSRPDGGPRTGKSSGHPAYRW